MRVQLIYTTEPVRTAGTVEMQDFDVVGYKRKYLLVIQESVKELSKRQYQGARIHTLSDSQATLKPLRARIFQSKLTGNCLLTCKAQRNTVAPMC